VDYDSVKEGFVKATERVVKLSGEVLERTKANYEIAKTNNAIKELYQKIGEEIFQQVQNGAECSDTIAKACREILALQEKRAEQEEILREIKKIKLCQSCGHENPKGNAFCSNCGQEMHSV
jgi:hypothetical protein